MLSEQSVIKSSTQRTRQKALTRRRILETALSLFAERGITATRSNEIAEAAGIAHGTLFLHFPTQEALIVAVIEDFGSGLCRRLHELSVQGDGLKAMLEAQLRGMAEREAFYARLLAETSLLPGAARIALIMIQSTISFHIARAAESGMLEGRITRQPVHLLFNTWMGLVHYYISNRELFAPGGSVLENRGPELVEHYMGLIAARDRAQGGDIWAAE